MKGLLLILALISPCSIENKKLEKPQINRIRERYIEYWRKVEDDARRELQIYFDNLLKESK